jgi:hypothetical protein
MIQEIVTKNLMKPKIFKKEERGPTIIKTNQPTRERYVEEFKAVYGWEEVD